MVDQRARHESVSGLADKSTDMDRFGQNRAWLVQSVTSEAAVVNGRSHPQRFVRL